MRRRTWSSFWAILAAIAGVIGAGAAVYPLLQSDQQAAHLVFPSHIDSPPFKVWVQALSEPIILTGNWYISRGPWWWPQTLRHKDALWTYDVGLSVTQRTLKDVRIPMNERRGVWIDDEQIANWTGGPIAVCNPGEFEIGIEYKWKSGSSWARTTLPLCAKKN